MSVMTMPAATVVGPARTPTPFGLFSTFAFRPAGARWQAGIRFDTAGCGPLRGYGPTGYCDDPADIDGLLNRGDGGDIDSGEGQASPFTVVAEHKCSPVASDHRALAETRLLSGEERAVEREFATGALGSSPTLRGATVAGEGMPLDLAVGLLEQFLAANYGAQGVLHVPRMLVAASPGSFRQSGQILRTLLGTPVAAGAGYDGSSPDGAAPSGMSRWIYITPALTGYRSEPVLVDTFDQRTNDRVVIASRDYLLMFEDCGTAAVLVDPAAGASGGGGGMNVLVDPDNPDLLILN